MTLYEFNTYAAQGDEIMGGETINVLDHGFVRYVDHYGSDARVVEAARVSYKSGSKGTTEDAKLLNYLYKNKHMSPFEMVKITFNIKMPIFVMRQYIRHRMQNVNEMSARYTELPNEFYIPKTWRVQSDKNKQSSMDGLLTAGVQLIEGSAIDMLTGDLDNQHICQTMATESVQSHCEHAYGLYEELLRAGVAREMARMVLPINIYTEFYCCWDLRNLLGFLTLRDDAHAQAEIQDYSQAMKAIARVCFPTILQAYDKYKWNVQEVA